jgi:hypothetical protein
LAIAKLNASVTPNASGKVYGAADPNPLTTGTLNGFLAGDNVTATYSRVAGENVGPYTISATLAPVGVLANYNITYNTAIFTIGKSSLVITASDGAMVFGGSLPTITASYSGYVNGDTALATPPVCSANAATHVTSCSGAADPDYTITYVPGVLTVNDAALVITANDQSRAFGAANPSFTFVVDLSVTLTTQPTCSTTATATSPVGTYPITCKNAALAGYGINYVAGTLTVNPAALTVTANDKTRVVGAADPAFTYTANPSVTFTTAPVCTSTATASSPVGTYPITCTGAVAAGYTISYVAGTLTISATPPSATPTAAGTEIVGGATATPTQVVAGATSTPARAATPPVTSSNGNSPTNDSLPLMIILIALAFGGLGLLAVQAQRGTIRR